MWILCFGWLLLCAPLLGTGVGGIVIGVGQFGLLICFSEDGEKHAFEVQEENAWHKAQEVGCSRIEEVGGYGVQVEC